MNNLLDAFKVVAILGLLISIFYVILTQETTKDRFKKSIHGKVVRKVPKRQEGNKKDLIWLKHAGREFPISLYDYSYEYEKIEVGDSIAKPAMSPHMRVYRNGKLMLDYPDIFNGRAYE